MAKIQPRVLKGFRDYLPPAMIARREMLARIEEVFRRFGFAPLMTPALEYLDILTGKYGEEGESLLYRFADQGGREVALRYDLTVPLARVIAQHGELRLPFRRYQIAPVWRAEKPARGRFREFVQCDGDIVGSADPVAESEVLQLAAALMGALGVDGYSVRVSHRKVLEGLMRHAGVEPGGAEIGVLRTIDKLMKLGREKTAELLREENGLSAGQVDSIFELLAIAGAPSDVCGRLRSFFRPGSAGLEGAEELERLFAILDRAGLAERFELDLSIARGLNYYTGTIYETFLADLPGFGAVMAGGRYDGLIGIFKGREVPAVGISLGIDRLLQGLVELGLLAERESVVRILVSVFDDATAPEAARLAHRLREAGIGCELYPGRVKIGKQFRHAERLGMRWVLVVGPEEAREGRVAVKDLESGEQQAMPEGEVVDHLRRALAPPAAGGAQPG